MSLLGKKKKKVCFLNLSQIPYVILKNDFISVPHLKKIKRLNKTSSLPLITLTARSLGRSLLLDMRLNTD